jgi:hypothetical protein
MGGHILQVHAKSFLFEQASCRAAALASSSAMLHLGATVGRLPIRFIYQRIGTVKGQNHPQRSVKYPMGTIA